MYGVGVILFTARKWFAYFPSRNYDDKNEPRSDLPMIDKRDDILEKNEQDRHISIHNIANE